MNWKRVSKLSKEEVERLCEKHSLKLPDDFIDKIGDINSGGLVSAHLDITGIGNVAYSRNVTLSDELPGNAFALFDSIDDSSKRIFPFGSVGNGDYFCFDMTSKHIVLYQHETRRIIPVCRTYTEFLGMIHED